MKYYKKEDEVYAIQFTLSNIEKIGKYIKRFELAFNIDGDTPYLIIDEKTKVREYSWIVFEEDKIKVVYENDFYEEYGEVK